MSYLLRVYQAPSGQWSGIVFEDGADIARIAGCASPGEVEDTARDQFPGIEVEASEEVEAFWASFDDQPNTDVDHVTLDVPPEFSAICARHGLTPAQVLAAFVADLAETPESNGSDERMRAAAWFDRVIWPEPDVGADDA